MQSDDKFISYAATKALYSALTRSKLLVSIIGDAIIAIQ